jgi:uncharacterized coiled-coil protein SlyX
MDQIEPTGEEKPEKKGGLFSRKKEETGPTIPDLLDQINLLGRRLRLLESRSTDLNRRIQSSETSTLNERKRFITEIKTINSDIVELKKIIEEIRHKMDLVVNDLKNFASKDELAVIKKYIEFWEPLNFVTRNEVEKIIEEKLSRK